MLCCCLVAKSCLTLYDPENCSLPGFSVHGILQARTLWWVAMAPFLSQGLNEPSSLTSPALAGTFFTTGATWEAH